MITDCAGAVYRPRAICYLWGEGEYWGTPPKPPAGKALHSLVMGELCGEGKYWGAPPSPRQGRPCTPWGVGRVWGLPQTPGRGNPAPLGDGKGKYWAPIAQTPGREGPASLGGLQYGYMLLTGYGASATLRRAG